MLVTSIEPVSKLKSRVFIEYEYAFLLTNKECLQYSIQEGTELSQADYFEIKEELLLPRAKRKAMDLLQRMDRTESELLLKLEASGFSKELCLEALAYVKKYNYVNDYRYACNYIRSRKNSKSVKMMFLELSRKGIDKEMAQDALDECCIDEDGSIEEEAVRREICRRCNNFSELTYEKKIKITASIYRKGYSTDVIRKVFDDLEMMELME